MGSRIKICITDGLVSSLSMTEAVRVVIKLNIEGQKGNNKTKNVLVGNNWN